MSMTSLKALSGPNLPRTDKVRGSKLLTVRRASLLTIMFATLLGTGVYLEFLASWNWNAGEAILLLHIALGLVFTTVFLSWIGSHVLHGLPKSRRHAFTWLSWLLLATYLVVVLTGLMMVIPSVVFLADQIWFWRFETTHVLTLLHLWGALAAAAGLVAHLYLRHWRQPAAGKGGSSS